MISNYPGNKSASMKQSIISRAKNNKNSSKDKHDNTKTIDEKNKKEKEINKDLKIKVRKIKDRQTNDRNNNRRNEYPVSKFISENKRLKNYVNSVDDFMTMSKSSVKRNCYDIKVKKQYSEKSMSVEKRNQKVNHKNFISFCEIKESNNDGGSRISVLDEKSDSVNEMKIKNFRNFKKTNTIIKQSNSLVNMRNKFNRYTDSASINSPKYTSNKFRPNSVMNNPVNIDLQSAIDKNKKKKIEIFNKIDKLNESRLKKLEIVVDKLASIDDTIDSKCMSPNNTHYSKIKNSDKYEINYIKTDSVNFGKISININHEDITKGLLSPKVKEKLSIKILSNWGNSDMIAINEIKLIDLKGKKISLSDCQIEGQRVPNFTKLINGKNNEEWSYNFSLGMKIDLFHNSRRDVHLVYLINGRDNKALKEIELINHDHIVWKGKLTKKSISKMEINRNLMKEFDSNDENLKSSINSSILNYFKSVNKVPSKIDSDYNDIHSSRESSVRFKKIKIIFHSNYGNKKYIGLTGLELIDENNTCISIEDALSIGALPKDINTINPNKEDPRIFENIFNNHNETVDDFYMWLTILDKKNPPFIEIIFHEYINLSALRIWNYNKKNELDKGVKYLELIFDDNYLNISKISLRMGIGLDKIDYSQLISYPFITDKLKDEELLPFYNFKPASYKFNLDFDTPYLPTGFIIKFIIINSWGDKESLCIYKIDMYDQLGKNILSNKFRYISSNQNNSERENCLIWSKCENLNYLLYIFDRPISLSYLKIENSDNDKAVKDIQIYSDEKLIYYGKLKKELNIVLFTSDENLIYKDDNLKNFVALMNSS